MRFRGLLGLFVLSWAAGCGSEPEVSFADLERDYFRSLNVFDPAMRAGLRDRERQFDRLVTQIDAQLDRGEPTDTAAKSEVGKALLYSSFVLAFSRQATDDAALTPEELIRPPHYAPGGDDRAELLAREVEAERRMVQAGLLRPGDKRVAPVVLGAHLTREVRSSGPNVAAAASALLDEAEVNLFGIFSALVLMRDPAEFPMERDYMQRLLNILCSPTRYDCNRMGAPMPAPMAPLPDLALLTQISGPAMIADLLMRQGESQLAIADRDPASAKPALNEALGRLQMGDNFLKAARFRSFDSSLDHYPASADLETRQARISTLISATQARINGLGSPPLPDATYYQGASYRSIYQCASCHLPRP